ncbi:MAG: hypothetical protein K2N32_04835 [Clostridia bacterium]|nr:hypothetical protein [Clostridia bacterium]
MDNKKFDYTYSAPTAEEKKEIEYIRRQYAEKEFLSSNEEKIKELRRLHSHVKTPATAVSLIMGIGGTLIFGLGLTMILEWNLLVWGSLVAVAGLIPIIAAHKTYGFLLNKSKKKYSEKILRLSEELLGEKKEIVREMDDTKIDNKK